jgi:voltage-gated potassium channel Kch
MRPPRPACPSGTEPAVINEDPPLPYLREVLLFLALAGVLIPLLQRLRVHAVLGFLGVGALLGPFGLGRLADAWAPLAWLTIPRIEGVVALAEVGVLFLMFMIGLDLSAERLWSMRRWVFGAGAAQVLACTLAIGAIAWAWGNPPDTALALVREPLWLPLSVVGLFLLKASITAAVLRGFGLPRGHAVEAGLLLGQGGEFAFIVIGVAMLSALMPLDVGQFMMLTVGLSMVITPLVAPLARLAGRRLAHAPAAADAGPGLPELDGRVLIAGYGRVGRLIGQVLDGQGVSYVAVDTDAERVGRARAEGAPVYVGDAARAELLRALGLRRASLVVLTMDDPAAASRAAASIRRVAPELPVLARARDESHAAELRRAGATRVVPEALEAGLQLVGAVFETRGTPREAIELLLEHERSRRSAFNAAGR